MAKLKRNETKYYDDTLKLEKRTKVQNNLPASWWSKDGECFTTWLSGSIHGIWMDYYPKTGIAMAYNHSEDRPFKVFFQTENLAEVLIIRKALRAADND